MDGWWDGWMERTTTQGYYISRYSKGMIHNPFFILIHLSLFPHTTQGSHAFHENRPSLPYPNPSTHPISWLDNQSLSFLEIPTWLVDYHQSFI
jgi:hypothetical protein